VSAGLAQHYNKFFKKTFIIHQAGQRPVSNSVGHRPTDNDVSHPHSPERAAFTAISGATTATYTPAYDDELFGRVQYKCKVSGSGVSVESNAATVTYGCGAASTGGGWLTFQCFNLGATVTATTDPFSPSKDITGNQYQWGRKEVVTTVNTPTGKWDYSTFTQAQKDELDITFWDTSQDYWSADLWNSGTEDAPIKVEANDPCLDGWRVPTWTEMSAILGDNLVRIGPFSDTEPYQSGYAKADALFFIFLLHTLLKMILQP
jgi:hypothetical protein